MSNWFADIRDPRFRPVLVSQDGSRANTPAGDDDTFVAPDCWAVIGPPGIVLNPNLPEIVVEASARRPQIDVFYGDEVVWGDTPTDDEIILKPALDLAYLVADDYVGLPLVVRGAALRRLGGMRADAGSAAAYDLVLRALSAGIGVDRITEVLAAHTQARPRPAVAYRERALHQWLAGASDQFDIGAGLAAGTLQLRRRFHTFPAVTIVLPTKQGVRQPEDGGASARPFVLDCLDSIARTDWPMEKLHVLVGDAVADERIYRGQSWPFRLTRMIAGSPDNSKFNYATKINELWRAARTEHLVVMNDDIVAHDPGWLKALLTFSIQDDVGAAGARLLYPDGNVQHAGMPGGVFDLCTHAWVGEPGSAPTYQNWAAVHRQWSMVTGAVFATRKSVLETLNGFDEQFRLDFNDVDLCLRMRMLGYRVVYTPFAELTHYEKASRGEYVWRGSELAGFLTRWGEFLDQDPAYHPRLTRSATQIAPVRHVRQWWQDPGLRVARGSAPARAVDPPLTRTPTGHRPEMRRPGAADQTIALAYLAWMVAGEEDFWFGEFNRFLASYRGFPPGADHALYVIYNGFQPGTNLDRARRLFAVVDAREIHLDDAVLDIEAYRAAARQIAEDRVCFLNTYGEPLAPRWLEKLAAHLDRPDVGLVGATGSFESLGGQGPGFPPFPNAHLRSNGFMIDRKLFNSLLSGRVIRDKRDTYLIESGPDSLTREVRARGLNVMIVGANGRGYPPRWWPSSDTFRQGCQQNLLIGDNHTRGFIAAPRETRQMLMDLAWGSYVDPADALPLTA